MSTHRAVRLTQELVRLDTVNPPGQEEACARLLADRLGKSGFEIDLDYIAPGRPNLIARLRGTSHKPALCFSGHLDTVPLGAETWTRPPLGGEIHEGRVWGRGTTDMKAGVAAFVVAAEAFADKTERPADIVLMLSASEETGCQGAAAIAQSRSSHGKVGAFVVAEPTANAVVHGHKGAVWAQLSAKGKTAHGSMPDLGVNAIYKLADAVNAIRAFRFSDEPHPLLGAPSLNVGTITGGQNVNSVPDTASLMLDLRTVWPRSTDRILKQIAAAIGPDIDIAQQLCVPSLATDIDDPWVKRVEQVVTSVTGESQKPRAATYFTDGAILREAFDLAPTILLGPGEPSLAHQTDESCRLDMIEAACEMYKLIIEDWQRAD